MKLTLLLGSNYTGRSLPEIIGLFFCFLRVKVRGGALPEIIEKKTRFFVLMGEVLEGPFQKFVKKRGVVSGRLGSFVLCVFSNHAVFLKLPSVASALFRVTHLFSRSSSSILRVWSGTKRIRCWVRF